ncbi:MAG: hypothetical protein KDE15_04085 [Erythrobacter sp.]|nr:hypothetical protein [Erythrobacter sp.]
MSSEQERRDFIRGMTTVGTIFENPFPTTMAEWNGQQFGRVNREDGGGLYVVMLAIPVLAAALALAVASIPSAIVLLTICVVLNPNSRVTLWDSYVAASFALCGLLIAGGLLLGLFMLVSDDQSPSSLGFQLTWSLSYVGEWLWNWGNAAQVSTTPPPASSIITTLAVVSIPLLATVSLILRWRLPEDFGGTGRWTSALVAAGLYIILAPLVIAAIVIIYPKDFAPGEALGGFSIWAFGLYGALVTIVGAFALAWFAARFLAPLIVRNNSGMYRAFWWAIAADIALVLASFLLFRGADEAGAAMVGTLGGIPTRASFWHGLPGLLKIALPGVLVGSVIVGLGQYSAHRFRTFALTLAVFAPVLLAISFASLTLVLALTLFGV